MKNLLVEIEKEDGRGKHLADDYQICLIVSAKTEEGESEVVFHSVFSWEEGEVVKSVIEDKCKEAQKDEM